MKRLILALLPVLMAAQIPFSVTELVPSDWKKNFDFGVKWTELLVESYSTLTNNEQDKDSVPSGIVTTTVAMAMIPEPEDFQIVIEPEICRAQIEIARRTREVVRIQKKLNTKLRSVEFKVKTIQL